MEPTEPVVYRIWDAAGRLIYIGATSNLDRRLNTHRTQAWWFALAHRVEAQPYPSMPEAFDAETSAIHSEKPAFNARGLGGLHRELGRLTESDVRVCQAWLDAKSKRSAGALPVSLRWVDHGRREVAA